MTDSLKPFLIPASIIISGLIIAAAVLSPQIANKFAAAKAASAFGNSLSAAAVNMKAPNEADHRRGPKDADVTIIEYSDFQCPFCSEIDPSLKKILSEYPEDVAWVYRHLPLVRIHPQAMPAAVASECVAELAGEEAFWTFADTMFERQRELSPALYAEVAVSLGIDKAAFDACYSGPDAAARVQEDFEDAVEAGGSGTPYLVVQNGNGDLFPFSGALPYAAIKSVIEKAIATSN